MLSMHQLKIFAEKNFEIMTKQNNFEFFITIPKSLSIEALWYKNHENPWDRKSHTWAPLKVPKCEIFHLFDF